MTAQYSSQHSAGPKLGRFGLEMRGLLCGCAVDASRRAGFLHRSTRHRRSCSLGWESEIILNANHPNTSLNVHEIPLHSGVLAIAIKHGCVAEFKGDLRCLGPENMGGYSIVDETGQLLAGENFHLGAKDVFAYFGEPLPEVGV